MAHHGTLSYGEQVLECFFCASDFYGENGWNECRLVFNRFMKTKAGSILNWVMPVVLVGLLLLATAFLVDGSYNPFLYFRF